MANIIQVKVDVRKLDKARFFEGKPDRNGHKPLYVDLVLFPRKEVGQYGDTHMAKQSKKRDENVEMPIVGNATERGGASAGSQSASTPPPHGAGGTGPTPQSRPANDDPDDCPF